MSSHVAALVDPLDHITREFMQNPYPALNRLRTEAPVFWSEKPKYWIITKYSDAHSILRDLSFEKGFMNVNQVNPLVHLIPGATDLIKSAGNWMLVQDPPSHTRLRSLVNKAFTPSMVNQLRPHIQNIADALIDIVEEKGQMDLISEFAFVIPVTVIAEMLGIPPEDRNKLHEWSRTLTEIFEPKHKIDLLRINRAHHANEEMIDYLRPIVAERRKTPREDLISALVKAESEEGKLTEEELLANCVLLLVAGHETTVNLIGNGVLALLRHPDQLELLKARPELIGNAVEECLRFDSPVQLVRRKAAQELELSGQKIARGDLIVVLIGACNRDPDVYPDPDKLDITRQNIKHLSFGEGIHHCLGASLARAEGEIAIGTLIRRLPNLRLKTGELEYKEPFALRGVKEMLVEF